MTAPVAVGIDPGKSGGIALVYADGSAEAHKMPETVADLVDLMRELWTRFSIENVPPVAWMEDVQPGGLHRGKEGSMGAKSAFTFGRGVGQLEVACVAHGFRLERVRPQKWQQAIGCLTKGDKNVSKAKAQELFPGVKKVTHAIADALLIAEYGRRQK